MGIDTRPLEIKKLMGYLPENAPLYPEMLVYDYLGFVADIRGLSGSVKNDRIQHLAGICGIREVMHQAVGELSRGYKQRVGLAQAMMGDPEILVLDEPTSGLDPNQIIEIREIIKQIGREKTVVLSTHILSEAEATCDRVVIINKGKIVADSSIENLKQTIGEKTQLRLSLKNADYKKAHAVLSGVKGVHTLSRGSSDRDDLLSMELTCERDDTVREDVYKAIKQTDWMLMEMSPQAKSLEHVFRELTKEN